jgi:LmbE family N-acetylglucosaminyl deacetylase
MLVISPHFDDAVLSCGALIAAHPGAVVLTVFAGMPQDGSQRTDWDARCGFASAAHAMIERRREDDSALALLHARGVRMRWCDEQYGQTPDLDTLAAALALAIDAQNVSIVLYPMGLFHHDHRLAHDAATAALRSRPAIRGCVYEDVPYRSMKGLVQRRLSELAAQGWIATPTTFSAPAAMDLKRKAVAAYASQVRALGPGRLEDAMHGERVWEISRRPGPASH